VSLRVYASITQIIIGGTFHTNSRYQTLQYHDTINILPQYINTIGKAETTARRKIEQWVGSALIGTRTYMAECLMQGLGLKTVIIYQSRTNVEVI